MSPTLMLKKNLDNLILCPQSSWWGPLILTLPVQVLHDVCTSTVVPVNWISFIFDPNVFRSIFAFAWGPLRSKKNHFTAPSKINIIVLMYVCVVCAHVTTSITKSVQPLNHNNYHQAQYNGKHTGLYRL